MKHLAPVLLAGLLAGCTVGPDYAKPQMDLPPGWTGQKITDANARAAGSLRAWWLEFDDPVLTGLVDDVIAGNLQLRMAKQRLQEARAERVIAASGEYPQIDAGVLSSLSNSSTTLTWPPGNGQYRTYSFGFDASWELDIFGGTRRAEEAADDTVQAAIEDRRAILVTLLAELADEYSALRATQARLAIAGQNIAVAQRAVDLTQAAFARGLAGDVEVRQARAQMETVEATVPVLEARAARLIHALSVLTGRFPGELNSRLAAAGPAVPVPPDLPLSLPSEVVAARPDIRRAERRLAASTARIGVAVSDLYPHFSIPLMLMPTTSYLSQTFSAASLAWSIGLSAGGNVADGGRRDARVDEARAAAELDRDAYRQTVLTGFREVEDTLSNLQSEERRRVSLLAAVTDSRAAADHAQTLYARGLTNFLTVLTAERTLYAAQDQLALSDEARVQNVIALYQSLGGGWQAVRFGDEVAIAQPAGVGSPESRSASSPAAR